MFLLACALLFELCLTLLLWRLTSRRPSAASQLASFFICLAGACCLGLATQGFFFLAVDVLHASELLPTIFWLTWGSLAFAVAFALKPSPASASIPCILVALHAFAFSFVYADPMTAVVGLASLSAAILSWLCARYLSDRAGGRAPKSTRLQLSSMDPLALTRDGLCEPLPIGIADAQPRGAFARGSQFLKSGEAIRIKSVEGRQSF